jgi:EmrB/QacA subfamily drug resistance transporter
VDTALAQSPGSEALGHPRRWSILAVLCTSLLVIMVGNSSLNVALPSIARELGASNSSLQWIVDAYSLVFAGMLFTAGSLGDRFGRKGALQFGMVVFLAGAVSASLASSAEMVIFCRALMGFGAAFVMPATLSILINAFPTHERAKAIAAWSAVAGAGGALGPVASGLLLKHFGWSSVFLVNVPIILVALVAGAFLVPTSRDPGEQRIDVLGALLSIVAISGLVYAIIEAPSHGWLSAETVVVAAASLAILGLFIVWELRTRHPMLDLRWFEHAGFSIGSLGMLLTFFALYGMMFLLTQYLQLVSGYSALGAAVHLLPIALVMLVVAPFTPRVVNRFGANRTVGFGLLVVAAGAMLLSHAQVDSSYAFLLAAMVVMVSGISLSMAPLTNAIMAGIPRDRAGAGSAMNDTTRELGGALGVAVLGSVVTSHYAHALAPSLTALPSQAATAASSSLSGALSVASKLGPAGTPIATAAQHAFVGGMGMALTIGAAVIAVAAILAFKLLPAEVAEADHAPVELPVPVDLDVALESVA